ncbi:hypothetical protein, partial [Xenorhabdus hominickii]|uniref:hypothetical protein n=1 Tax=Xenorhabdus hominickii TaxID=351679 RepID=UPI001B80C743
MALKAFSSSSRNSHDGSCSSMYLPVNFDRASGSLCNFALIFFEDRSVSRNNLTASTGLFSASFDTATL